MSASRDVDNRNMTYMASYYESRIEALRRRVKELENGSQTIPFPEAMVCLDCTTFVRYGPTSCHCGGNLVSVVTWVEQLAKKPECDAHLGAVAE